MSRGKTPKGKLNIAGSGPGPLSTCVKSQNQLVQILQGGIRENRDYPVKSLQFKMESFVFAIDSISTMIPPKPAMVPHGCPVM
mmetsp:Transcript_20579/g.33987  ORF Transcript_20579/g.33987 Transcript_20579/m.33987 type:complete len:83 (-) Transcript_20579:1452-1700(-)